MTRSRIVLGGGIGAGKSAASARFSQLGAVIISADDVARHVLDRGTPGHAAVASAWPEVMVDGEIDRSRLGAIVFSDPVALAHLETITHPETRARVLEIARENDDHTVVVEIPVLRDWFAGWIIVVVDAPDETRVMRAVARDPGRDEAGVRAIMASQPSRSQWLLAADFVVDNSGDEPHLASEVDRVWARLGAA